MAYIIVRGSEKQGGYVSMVEKGRVNGVVRTIRYICGLGTMTVSEFKAFQMWAHKLKPQEYRKQMVLSSGKALMETEEIPKRTEASHEAIAVQKVIKRKMTKKTQATKRKSDVRKHYPVPPLSGYKGLERGKTHTQIMRERQPERKEKQRVKELKERYARIPDTERKERIEKLQDMRKTERKEWRHWDAIISEGGLYASNKEKAHRTGSKMKIERIDKEIKRLEA